MGFGGAGILCGCAPQAYSTVEHSRDTVRLDTAGIPCDWALQGYSAVRHCTDGEENKSNNTTVGVKKNGT